MMKSSDKSPVRRHDPAKHVNSEAVSSSSSFTDSASTCSLMTPSLEFPDRISFREMDLSEAGPSRVVVTSSSTNRDITELIPSKSSETENCTDLIPSESNKLVPNYEDVSVSTSSLMNRSLVMDRIMRLVRRNKTSPMRRLDRRDAVKNIIYDAAEDLTVSSSLLMTRSLDLPNRTSFRVGGVDEGGSINTSWQKGHLLRQGLFGSVYEAISDSLLMTRSLDLPNRTSFRVGGVDEGGSINTSWQKGHLLRQGSFGSVYEAFSEDGDFFAVKEVSLLDQGSQAQECIQQLEGEIALLSQLQHQNIVRYRGSTKDGSNLYIFLELVSQGSLQTLYRRYQLRDSVVSLYTRQILDGLKYLHDKGCVHRDINCANILVDTNGAVKLADFGLAKVSEFINMKDCKGNPFWMAPEVINPKLNDGYGSLADIWSLGCTVLEMCTGQIPYSDLPPVKAIFTIGRGTLPEIPDTISQDAREFIFKCLKVNPDERPTAAELLNHPFVRRPLPSMGSGGSGSASRFSVDEANPYSSIGVIKRFVGDETP